jgi:hypothetical protein
MQEEIATNGTLLAEIMAATVQHVEIFAIQAHAKVSMVLLENAITLAINQQGFTQENIRNLSVGLINISS